MISRDLAQALRDGGLRWEPRLFDFFAIPDRDLDDRFFCLSDLTIDVQEVAGHSTIMFNGAVEWSLDYILDQDVIWLPTEGQLRELLGDRLRDLEKLADGYRCTVVTHGGTQSSTAATAEDAYGQAVLELLEAGGLEKLSPPSDAAGSGAQ